MFYPPDYIDKRVISDQLHRKLVSLGLSNTYTLFGTFIAGSRDLINFAGEGPLNTDDQPVVIFKAPEFAYDDDEPAYVRLLTVLDNLNPNPDQILQGIRTNDEKDVYERLSAYWAARKRFLHAGVGVKQTADVEQMLHQVQAPLLSIVRQSPDFEAAYNPLFVMARQLQRVNPEAARHLLLDLEAANPFRQDAKRMLEYLGMQ